MSSRNPPPHPSVDYAGLEAVLAEMFPDLLVIRNLLRYNLLACPVVSLGMMVDLDWTESSQIQVLPSPVESHSLKLEISITRVVAGTGKKAREKETHYVLEIIPVTFVSRKQFHLKINVWVGKKRYSYVLENNESVLQSIFSRIHKKVLLDWLKQFETLHRLELDETPLYQMLFQFFEPEEDVEIA